MVVRQLAKRNVTCVSCKESQKMRIISPSVFTSVRCHILADGWGIVLDLGESNSFPQI